MLELVAADEGVTAVRKRAESDGSGPTRSSRVRLAAGAGRLAAAASRRAGRGGGSVIGGRVALALAPDALGELAADRTVLVVSGTNGKTTTTALLSALLRARGEVASNAAGSNMPAGMLGALLEHPGAPTAVLEVDEAYLPATLARVRPRVVVLLNLSRDQLDRHHEVAGLAARWRAGLAAHPPEVVVANADDPLVAWAAGTDRPAGAGGPRQVWVAGGQTWRQDSALCPRCAGALSYDESGWACAQCGLRRPPYRWSVELGPTGAVTRRDDGLEVLLALHLPGRANRANATTALAAAEAVGLPPAAAGRALAAVGQVQGRYAHVQVGQSRVRLLLAKNPAGWQESLEVLGDEPHPVLLEVNDAVADGRDPSWLWDVPFEQLSGREVVATGTRALDLSVRLRYAEVPHRVAATVEHGVAGRPSQLWDYVGNYTAFQALYGRSRRAG